MVEPGEVGSFALRLSGLIRGRFGVADCVVRVGDREKKIVSIEKNCIFSSLPLHFYDGSPDRPQKYTCFDERYIRIIITFTRVKAADVRKIQHAF